MSFDSESQSKARAGSYTRTRYQAVDAPIRGRRSGRKIWHERMKRIVVQWESKRVKEPAPVFTEPTHH